LPSFLRTSGLCGKSTDFETASRQKLSPAAPPRNWNFHRSSERNCRRTGRRVALAIKSASLQLHPKFGTAVERREVPEGDIDEALFDHLVCAGQHRKEQVEDERLCGLKVDGQIKSGRPLHRQVGGLFAAKANSARNPTSIQLRRKCSWLSAPAPKQRHSTCKWKQYVVDARITGNPGIERADG
jgi:hypothetical protein